MKIGRYAGLMGLCALLGCASNVEEEDRVVRLGLGTECASAAPTAQGFHGFDFQSPFTYSTPSCYKGVVYDVYNYDGNLGTSEVALETRVRWGSGSPAVADCEAAVVFSNLFEISAGGPVRYLESKSAYGVVSNGTCLVPALSWTTEMIRGRSYRVSAGARLRRPPLRRRGV